MSFIKISAVNVALFLEANMYVFLSNLCETLSKGSANNAADFVWICREGCTVLMGVNQITYRRVP